VARGGEWTGLRDIREGGDPGVEDYVMTEVLRGAKRVIRIFSRGQRQGLVCAAEGERAARIGRKRRWWTVEILEVSVGDD